ncbi:hypothetical protein GXM_06193 [Nostoc sphaeroides CCNUC1]|uniref:Uncharacterized protein n=1 Tax=Nostoc sphaeroides CCNUC1 TaxID=2653204 RepID=A0A5P8W9W5_9NOSO|nr:hypothetical protein GXM_06193 [Nostoc sphaeroides CCNUC1]
MTEFKMDEQTRLIASLLRDLRENKPIRNDARSSLTLR